MVTANVELQLGFCDIFPVTPVAITGHGPLFQVRVAGTHCQPCCSDDRRAIAAQPYLHVN